MKPAPPVGLWSLLPPSLRAAGVLALATSIVAAVVVYVSTGEGSPEFSRGGRFGESTNDRAFEDLTIPTPAPRPGAVNRPRSEAVLTAPRTETDDEPDSKRSSARLPTFGTYTYAVEGTEEAPPFGDREYPPQMTMTVSSGQSAATTPTDAVELVFDLEFSDDHEEREIVAYGADGVAFTYEAGSISFGITQTSEATYKPPMLQIPAKLRAEAVTEGTSRAVDPSGEETRVEDWTVTVEGRETVPIMGEQVSTWIVQIERQSREGSSEQVTRTRRYWYSPAHNIWVKWEETMNGSQDFGPGSFSYSTEFTATLEQIEPL